MTAIATSAKNPQAAGPGAKSPGAKSQAATTDGKSVATSVWSCLLVSADERLRRRMKLAATTAGWRPVECRTPEESMRQAVLSNFPLALVDLNGPGQVGEALRAGGAFDDLLRTLKQSASNLVVICDRDSNPEGELWSRQLGAWMYLPNVDEKSDLARICREAKAIAEKLRGTALADATH